MAWDFETEPEFQRKLNWAGYIADSYAQLVQFRLFVLYTAKARFAEHLEHEVGNL